MNQTISPVQFESRVLRPPPPEVHFSRIPIPISSGPVLQVYYGQYGEPVTVPPNHISFEDPQNLNSGRFPREAFEEVLDFPNNLDRYKIITLVRTFALGDTILVVPLLKYLKKKYPHKVIAFCTPQGYQDLYSNQEFHLIFGDRNNYPSLGDGEIRIILDRNTFECDHVEEHPFSRMHRTDILYELFHVPPEERIYDYSLNIPEKSRRMVQNYLSRWKLERKKFITFPWKGSNLLKTFPFQTRRFLIERLSQYYPVVVFDPDAHPEGTFSNPRVFWFLGHSITETVELIGNSRMLITTDTGALWMAYIAQNPVISLLGPTPENIRMNRHPEYPRKAFAVDLKLTVGCPKSCLHSMSWCEGKISCLHFSNPDLIWKELENGVNRLESNLS